MTATRPDDPGDRTGEERRDIHLPGPRAPIRPVGDGAGLSGLDLRSAFDNAPIGMALVTPIGVITACNAALGRLLDRAPHELLGGTFFDVTDPEDLEEARYNCSLMHAGAARIIRHECRFRRPDDSIVWVLVSTSRVPEQARRPAHLIMHIEDITDRKRLEHELSHRALHDPLTGLPNRTLLTGNIQNALTGTGRHTHPAHLFYLDLDGFKAVNDQYGHHVGDQVLCQLAHRLTLLLRPDDTAARIGGDEFAVLCVATAPEHADAIAERLRSAAAEPFTVDGHTLTLSAAVGHTTIAPHADTTTEHPDPADLLQRADQRMYEAKRRRTPQPPPSS
jgi:diguanylate cyclase (GGDEF)-like protein/PAS domain S-box-containing protein